MSYFDALTPGQSVTYCERSAVFVAHHYSGDGYVIEYADGTLATVYALQVV